MAIACFNYEIFLNGRSRMSLSFKQSKIKICIEKEESNNAANYEI